MNAGCTIRQLGTNDADSWVRLRREAIEAHPLAFGASIPEDPNVLYQFAVERLQPGNESAVFGAYSNRSLVGIVGIRRDSGIKERHKSGIWGMYVTAENRRNGAGEMLLRAAIHHAQSWPGMQQIHLDVNDVAPEAKRLYERNGFREYGRQPRALCWEGHYTDSYHLILDLAEPDSRHTL